MLSVSRACSNEFLSLLDVAWVNKVLLLLLFDLPESGLFEQVFLAQIHFLPFLRDTSPAYEISL